MDLSAALNLQDVIWTIALIGMGLVAAGFIHIVRQAGKPADDEARAKSASAARQGQTWLFSILLIIFISGSWASLRRYPIAPQHRTLDVQQVVSVVGQQWLWKIEPATVETGTVEFQVTSTDVNHGFAIYSPDGHIVAQTQAMPGYTNKLLYTFSKPGTYRVMCLEYCGLGHAPMIAAIQVTDAMADTEGE